MEVGTTENSSAITNTKKTWRLEQLRIHLHNKYKRKWRLGTTENSSAITNTRKHGGWNN